MSLLTIQNSALLGIHDMLRQSRVKHQICVFRSDSVAILKTYEQLSVSNKLQQSFSGMDDSGYTPLAKAMRTEADKLLRRREKRKIMLIMTDGTPDNKDDVLALIRVLRELGVEVYGFGLCCGEIVSCFPDGDRSTVVAIDPMEIPDRLAELTHYIATKAG